MTPAPVYSMTDDKGEPTELNVGVGSGKGGRMQILVILGQPLNCRRGGSCDANSMVAPAALSSHPETDARGEGLRAPRHPT